jgi:hypothetical protein
MDQNPLIEAARRIVPNLSRSMAFVYFLRLCTGKIYVGCPRIFWADLWLVPWLAPFRSDQACRGRRPRPGLLGNSWLSASDTISRSLTYPAGAGVEA